MKKTKTCDPCFEELKTALENFAARYEERHDDLVNRVNKINGSVADISKWRFGLAGAIAALGATTIPILLYLIQLHLSK